MAQKFGGDDYRLTCSDYTECPWSETVTGHFVNGEFRSHGVDGWDGSEGK
jgi:hypothetical protein